MTLILAAQRPRPFIISDLMLTRPGAGMRVETVLPSAGVINVNKWIQARPDTATRYYFSGVVQKLSMINDYLMVAWAGNMFSAKLLIRRLGDIIGGGILSGAELNAMLTSNNDLIGDQLSLVCMGLEGPTASECYVVGRNCHTVSTANFGEIMIAGTGAKQIIDLLSALRTYTIGEIIDGGLTFHAVLTGIENVSKQTLAQQYGGGFEVAGIADGKIQKLNKVTSHYHFISKIDRCDLRSTRVTLSLPPVVTRQFYDDGNNLVIVRAEMSHTKALKSGKSAGRITGGTVHIIAPVERPMLIPETLARHSGDVKMLEGDGIAILAWYHVTDALNACVLDLHRVTNGTAIVVDRTKDWWIIDFPMVTKQRIDLACERLGIL